IYLNGADIIPFSLFSSGKLIILFFRRVALKPKFQVKSPFLIISPFNVSSKPLFTKSPTLRVTEAVPEPEVVEPTDNGKLTLNNKSLDLLSKYSTTKFIRLNNLPSKANEED